MRNQFVVVGALLLIPVTAPAQPYIDPTAGRTMEQLTALALQQAPEILAARAEIEVARGELRQADLRPNPTLSAGRREEPGGSDNQTSLMLQVPLDLFRRAGRVDTAREALTAAQLGLADRERLLAVLVRERAGAALVAARLLAVTDDLIAVTRRTFDLLAARVAEGAAPPLERDVAEVELRRLEAERASRVADAAAAIVELKAAIGVSPAEALALREDLEQQVRADGAVAARLADVAVDDVVARRPDVREAEARTRVAEARGRQLQREARFDVSVYGSYMRMDAGFPQRAFDATGALERIRGVFHYAEFGGTLTLPIFNRNQGAIAAADAARQGAVRTRESRQLLAGAEIEAARLRVVQAARAVELLARARQLARANVEIVREAYQLGRSTLFELFAEQRRLIDVEMAYANALATAFVANTALIRASGVTP